MKKNKSLGKGWVGNTQRIWMAPGWQPLTHACNEHWSQHIFYRPLDEEIKNRWRRRMAPICLEIWQKNDTQNARNECKHHFKIPVCWLYEIPFDPDKNVASYFSGMKKGASREPSWKCLYSLYKIHVRLSRIESIWTIQRLYIILV